MDEQRQKVVLGRLYRIFSISALVIYLLLMFFVLPWWHVSSHPVMISMGAGISQDIRLSYAVDEDPIPLVPVGSVEGYHWKWGAELPPRNNYDLALVFPSGIEGEVLLKQVKVFGAEPEATISLLGEAPVVEPEDGLVRLRRSVSGYRINAEPGGSLTLPFEPSQRALYDWIVTWFKATLGYVVVAFILFLTLSTFLRFPDGIRAFRKKTPTLEIVLLLLLGMVGALIHLYLVRHAMPSFNLGESDAVVLQAIGEQPDGTPLPSQGIAPFYPYMVGKIAQWTGWDLSNQIAFQGGLFAASVILLGLSIVRMLQAYIVGPFLILAMLSPPSIWASRHIGTESVLASVWLIALAAFIFSLQRNGWLRWVGMAAFSICAVWATSTDPAGLILYLLPVGLIVGTVWWSISVRGGEFWEMSILWRSLGQACLPFVALFLANLYLSGSQPGEAELVVMPSPRQEAPFELGLFEVSPLVGTPAYAEVVKERLASKHNFDGLSLRQYPGLSKACFDGLPLRAKLMAWGKLSAWGLFLPKVEAYSGNPLNTNYQIQTNFRNKTEAESVRQGINNIMRQTGVAVHVMEKWSNRHIVNYNSSILPVYSWAYRLLLLAAIAGWMVGLAERKYLAAVLVLPVLLKILYQVMTLDVSSQYIQSLDALLWLGAVAGLVSVNPKALQKQTDISDRRCLPPIRPRQLMTRHKDVPGTQGLPLDH